jgi:soluble lytic murein transglycosylase-like protein
MTRLSSTLCLALLPSLLPSGAHADVYKFVNPANGHVEYTDKPVHKGYRLIIQTPEPFTQPIKVTFGGRNVLRARNSYSYSGGDSRSLARNAALQRNRSQYSRLIADAADRHGLDPALLHAVIRAESSYNPNAVSHKGAIGLMQLMPATAARYGVDPHDPEENVHGGARYLSDLIDLFGSDIPLAVAAYNAGENNVIKYGNRIPPFHETQQYVNRVMSYYNR